MKKYRLNIKSDIYCDEDQLGFDIYIDTLNTMFTDKDFTTPFCIGIVGKWGSGKTSFMHLLENRLLKDNTEPRIIPVWFNPWKYEKGACKGNRVSRRRLVDRVIYSFDRINGYQR